MEADLRRQFGPLIYGADVDSLEQVVLHGLLERGLTLSCAESCTGGLTAKRITDLPGASKAFRGGVVSYTDGVKAAALGVPEALLREHGAVSAPVAAAMAEGGAPPHGERPGGVTTGVAGPDPDDRGNPVGLVFVALAGPDGTVVKERHLGGTRARVRTTAASCALDPGTAVAGGEQPAAGGGLKTGAGAPLPAGPPGRRRKDKRGPRLSAGSL